MLLQKLLVLAAAWQTSSAALVGHRLQSRDGFQVDRYAALGDSFAAGPGAGPEYDHGRETWCHRHEGSWTRQVAADDILRKGRDTIDAFGFIACTGALTKHVFKEPQSEDLNDASDPIPTPLPQAQRINGFYPQLVTLSIGGNDVGFSYLLDQCVYRFWDFWCNGCDSSPDCSEDCAKAITQVRDRIDGVNGNFPDDLRETIKAIFENAPGTNLFITGYPRFFNQDTEYCNNVTFELWCQDEKFLPLTKDQRTQMNELNLRLNEKIQSVIDANQPESGRITYVDTDPYFEGHRFCEEGVKEPSYRNKNIWFFPCEFYTKVETNFTVSDTTPSGDCQAILDSGGGPGNYFTCLIANEAQNGTSIDLMDLPNNVATDDPNEPDAASLWLWLLRTFHPTVQGHEAYKNAFFAAYQGLEGTATPTSELSCNDLENKYVAKDALLDLIDNTYCPKLEGATGSIGTGHYFPSTPEAVEIGVTSRLTAGPVPTVEECKTNLHKILDECNNDKSKNPVDWKAGGEIEINGWRFTITPTGQRPSTPKAWCKIENCQNGEKCTASIWGAGWLRNDYGEKLRSAFAAQQAVYSELRYENSLGDSKGIDMSQWDFNYEALDGHEWHASLLLDLGLRLPYKQTVTDALRSAAGDGLEIGNGGDCESEVNY
ncbi:hypothetical protein J4E81_008108 [Alternaria sp. BMP 2799]|nr:hypothetical protein J4E81_008108 [Alternaria sp. BMP 2799]